MKRLFSLSTLIVGLVFCASWDIAAAPFYEGKTIRITVGGSAGGSFDLWARIVARHIGKHIPGNPTVIVDNIPGAGGLVQTNQLFKSTKADGLTMGQINGGLIFSQALGQPGYDFDSQQFIYIGAPTKDNAVFTFSKNSGISSVDKWRASSVPVKIGGLVPGNSIDNASRMMKYVLGFPTQVITGYKGTPNVFMAMESGELAGGLASWDNVKVNKKKQIETGDMIVVLQCVAKPFKDLPNIPRMIDLANTEEQKRLVELVIHEANDISRPFVLPPGTPKERVEVLRKAFDATVEDKELTAEVEKIKWTLDPLSGERMHAAVARLGNIDQATKTKLKDVLFK